MEPDGRRRRCSNWRHSPDAETDQNKKEMKRAMREVKEPNFKTPFDEVMKTA